MGTFLVQGFYDGIIANSVAVESIIDKNGYRLTGERLAGRTSQWDEKESRGKITDSSSLVLSGNRVPEEKAKLLGKSWVTTSYPNLGWTETVGLKVLGTTPLTSEDLKFPTAINPPSKPIDRAHIDAKLKALAQLGIRFVFEPKGDDVLMSFDRDNWDRVLVEAPYLTWETIDSQLDRFFTASFLYLNPQGKESFTPEGEDQKNLVYLIQGIAGFVGNGRADRVEPRDRQEIDQLGKWEKQINGFGIELTFTRKGDESDLGYSCKLTVKDEKDFANLDADQQSVIKAYIQSVRQLKESGVLRHLVYDLQVEAKAATLGYYVDPTSVPEKKKTIE